jgi:hypothetical protein
MAVIPLGNFDQARAIPQADSTRIDTSPTDIAGRGAAAIGGGLSDASQSLGQMAIHTQEKLKTDNEALAGAKALNARTAYELQVEAATLDQKDTLTRGGDFTKAPDELNAKLNAIPVPQIDGLTPHALEAFSGSLVNIREAGKLKLNTALIAARRDEGQKQFGIAVDLAGKAAALPGADIEAVNASLRQKEGFYQTTFGLDRSITSKAIENQIEGNWTNQAGQRYAAAGDNIGQLQALKHDLEAKDGFYLDKLDPDKRLAMTTGVQNRIEQVQTDAQVQIDKREKVAEGIVKDVVSQAVSGIPPTPDTLSSWSVGVAGTSHEGAFKQAVGQILEVQQVRRMPGPQQTAWLAAQETKLNVDGGSPQDLQRLSTVRAAIAHDRDMRDNNPLQFAENLTGKPPTALPMSDLVTGNTGAIGTALADRMATLGALRKQGIDVPMKPLKAEEVEQLTTIMGQLPTDKLLQLFVPLRKAIGSDDAYTAVMQQIAPNAELKAYAATLAVRPGGNKIASLVLRGDALLAGKGDKAWPMPAMGKFEEQFIAESGNAYQGRPDALKRDMGAARAAYAASAAQDGDTDAGKVLNPQLFTDSMRAVRGEVAEIGGVKTTVPWGMDPSNFEDRVHHQIQNALKMAGLDPDASGVGLIATPQEGRYVLVQGRIPLNNPSVKRPDGRAMPLFIDFNATPPGPDDRSGVIQKAREVRRGR